MIEIVLVVVVVLPILCLLDDPGNAPEAKGAAQHWRERRP
jgi:hypothetical protein